MHVYKSIALPSFEYARLQNLMLTMIGSRTVLASVLRRKLGSADPVSASDVAADIAVSGRRVQFRIDGQHSEEGVLTWEPPKRGDTVNLSLRSPRGLAMLGLGPGASVSYVTEGGRTEFLEVERVSEGEVHAADRGLSRIKTLHPSGIPDRMRIIASEGAFAGGQNG